MSLIFKQVFSAVLLGVGVFAVIHQVHAQDQSDFTSIDCGLPNSISSFIEEKTKIKFISDANFIDSGESKALSINNNYQPYMYLRSFPDGLRNCYKINVINGTKYLIRASFFYGNYDGKSRLPAFELHLGTDVWDSVRFTSDEIIKELIHVPLRNYIHICLVNTDSGVPFISAIELRPLPNTIYNQTKKESLAGLHRYDIRQTTISTPPNFRYPDDIHDRFWTPFFNDSWRELNTPSNISFESNEAYQLPSVVMSTAATPKDGSDSLSFSWPAVNESAEYHVYMHFAEVEKLQSNQSRVLNITRNKMPFDLVVTPCYLCITTIFSGGQYYDYSIFEAENATLPPIINAIEIYMVKQFLQAETNQDDVEAITNIKSTYKIQKNWQGDPCSSPVQYLWEGVQCFYPKNDSPRIISLNLSSSELVGEIAPSISSLTMIQNLDLSDNKLTGQIPYLWSQLQYLNRINLDRNNLTGSVPAGLSDKRKTGSLSFLSFCENPYLFGQVYCETKKHHRRSVILVIILPVIGTSIFLVVVAGIWWRSFKRKARLGEVTADPRPAIQLESTVRQFTYSNLLQFTNNFERVLGKGGFGIVYHGYIGDTQVAIKMLSPSSVQGFQQFHSEVNLLMRVHHRNLTSLVGYCNDKTHVGLVYEYMANGNLQEHLSGSRSNFLSWEDRLRIAAEAAQGLEYLHYGCKPPIVHRDVKSTNILLNENFQAKISDFGLSRIFPTETGTHISTVVVGTPGYFDPEYHATNRLNEKSDVYSFGIVLLEIITSRPVFSKTHEKIYISEWVGSMLDKGDIYSILDPRLQGNFSTNSVWKAVELAMACVSKEAIQRPIMSQVVVELKECLATELARTKQIESHQPEDTNSSGIVSANSITLLLPSVR